MYIMDFHIDPNLIVIAYSKSVGVYQITPIYVVM